MSELVFKRTVLNESISTLIRETECRRYIINEGFVDFFNYGVTVRAVDSIFGGRKKLEDMVMSEFKKRYKTLDITKIDPKEIEREIELKADSAAKKLAKQEFIDGVKLIFKEGLMNGVYNAFFNAMLHLPFNPNKTVDYLISGFINGVLVKFLFDGFKVLYNEVKKRIYKDPYATPSKSEVIVLMILTMVFYTTGYMLFISGGTATAGQITIAIILNILVSILMSILITIGLTLFRKNKNG